MGHLYESSFLWVLWTSGSWRRPVGTAGGPAPGPGHLHEAFCKAHKALLAPNEAFCHHPLFGGSGAASRASSSAKPECRGRRLDPPPRRPCPNCGPWHTPGHLGTGGPGGPWKRALSEGLVPWAAENQFPIKSRKSHISLTHKYGICHNSVQLIIGNNFQSIG